MKKLTFLFFTLGLLFVAPFTFAQSNSQTDKTTRQVLASTETVNSDYFATAGVVEISGIVNGDVYAFGGQILIDGKVNGDVIAAGGTVNISGEVSQDVRVAGGQVTITGKIGRSLTVGGGTVDVVESASVGGSIVAGGGSLTLAAPIAKGATIGGGNVVISNSVGGDINAGVGSLRLTSKAIVAGNITYWSNEKISIDPSAKVSGSVTQKTPPSNINVSPNKIAAGLARVNFFFQLASLVSLFILGLLFIRFLPGFMDRTQAALKERPWASLGIGLLGLILTPIVVIIFFITILGIPLAFLLLGLYVMSLFVTRLFVIYWLGVIIVKQIGSQVGNYLALLLGTVVFGLLSLIPIVGGLIGFFALLFGLGCFLIALKSSFSSLPIKTTK